MKKYLFLLLAFVSTGISFGQHKTYVKASLNDSLKSLYIQQQLEYINSENDTLEYIYLNDWMNAFSGSTTPLARRFFEDYQRDFHFAGEDKRGGTTINSVTTHNFDALSWERPETHPDLIRIFPEEPLAPGDTLLINLNYSSKIPSEEFTRYGYGRNKYQLRYWFLTPGIYRDGWQVYSHKNMEDLFSPPLDITIDFSFPLKYAAISPYEVEKAFPKDSTRTIRFTGRNRLETEVYLTSKIDFEDFGIDDMHVLTNIEGDNISPVLKSTLVSRISSFLEDRLGEYPHNKIITSRQDYAANPVYGLNQLPKFIRPFPDGFSYDLEQLKTLTENYLENTLLLNPRKDAWIYDGIQLYLMMEYVDKYYPDLKMIGSLSDFFGIRWFHASELDFNDQYSFMYLLMARQNLDQPLSTPQDSLVKFNKNIANPYKAAVGFKYLDAFLGEKIVEESLREFYQDYKLKPVTSEDFEAVLKKNSSKNIDWFFEDFVGTNEKIDFTISRLRKEEDSLLVTIKNRTENRMPVQIYGLNDNEVVFQKWVEDISEEKTVAIPMKRVETVALNYEGIVPEVNQRNNFRTVDGFMNKPLQLRLFKDIEDPRFTQLFIMPQFQYNLYDGVALGAQIYNSAILARNFEFVIAPLYGFNSQTFVGGAGVAHQIFLDDDDLYAINYGISGSRFSYGYDLLYQRFTPFLTLSFRNSYLRNSRKQFLNVRNVNVYRDQHPDFPLEVPNYSVFNINYVYSNPGLVRHLSGKVDFQLAEKFSKSSLTLEFKKLLENDRQVNLRFFGGAFIYNDLPQSDYFSFALDRPTDYLFDYNYYGRSETSGLFSQQIIMAEGGFKSMLEPEFANQWITTVNANTTIWKWIFAYGDIGLVKNKYEPAEFLYDSGIRLSIVQNHFELFFPVYSSEGWEFTDGNYDQKIRFIASLDLRTIARIFTREWF